MIESRGPGPDVAQSVFEDERDLLSGFSLNPPRAPSGSHSALAGVGAFDRCQEELHATHRPSR